MKYLLLILLSILIVGCIKPEKYKFTVIVIYDDFYSKLDTITTIAPNESDIYIAHNNLHNSWQGNIATRVRTFKIIKKVKE